MYLQCTKSAYFNYFILYQTELIINVPLYKGRKCLATSTAYGNAETSVNGSER
jgi:hypothetical protein